MCGDEVLDNLSVCPQYWEGGQTDPEEMETYKGKPEVLAQAWGLPLEQIRNYMVNWGYRSDPAKMVFHFERSGKAYPTDRHGYGEHEQFFDMLRALGGREPKEQHTINLPPREGKT